MPQVSTIISGAASLGVLAGVVSGIFYLVLTGIRWAGRVRAALQEEELRKATERCVSCGRCFAAVDTKPVVCIVCGRRACFDLPCSRPAPLGWTCVLCHVKRSDSSSGSWTDVKSDEEVKSNSKGDSSDIDGQTVQVRDFIEKLVEKIVKGPLDGVTVGKLSNHSSYLEMFNKYHEPLCKSLVELSSSLQESNLNEQIASDASSNSAHKALVQLIEKVVQEAMKLPNLSQNVHLLSEPHTAKVNESNALEEKSYEDILSTAILNKIIEKYQNQNGYNEYHLDKNRNHLDLKQLDQLGYSNDDESYWSDFSRPDPLAMKIEEHIEEVTTAYESSSDENIEELNESPIQQSRRVPFPEYGVDIVDGEAAGSSDSDSCATDIMSTHSTWEENWLFQKKKKIKSADRSCHPVPVPMLVPNPAQEYRPLIGGIYPEDISDLSECSDSALEEAMSEMADDQDRVMEIIDALNRESPILDDIDHPQGLENENSTTFTNEVIFNVVDDGVPEENKRSTSLSAEVTEELGTVEEAVTSTSSSDQQLSADSLEVDAPSETAPSPTPSLGQQDREIAVDYEIISQINRPPIPRPRTLDLSEPEAEEDLEVKPIKCPIAEREKAKWNNAIEMKDNPYTPENIAKRSNSRTMLFHNGSSSSLSVEFPEELTNVEESISPQRKYSRDYYIKASKSPTGETTTRSTDSPASIRSEASLEDSKSDHQRNVLEIWTDAEVEAKEEPATPTPRKRNLEKRAESSEESTKLNLPKVSELKKNFAGSKPPIPNRSRSLPPARKERIDGTSSGSSTPVSEIVGKWSMMSKNVPERKNKTNEVYEEIRRESLTKKVPEITQEKVIKTLPDADSMKDCLTRGNSEESSSPIEFKAEQEIKFLIKKKPIKPVHSLTARSIPKDFREGLKKNSQILKNPIPDRIGEIYSATDRNVMPSLNFDVKNKKKFWENIANNKK